MLGTGLGDFLDVLLRLILITTTKKGFISSIFWWENWGFEKLWNLPIEGEGASEGDLPGAAGPPDQPGKGWQGRESIYRWCTFFTSFSGCADGIQVGQRNWMSWIILCNLVVLISSNLTLGCGANRDLDCHFGLVRLDLCESKDPRFSSMAWSPRVP